MRAAIVGREAELASVRDAVASVFGGAALLTLEGDAGVGKTTLWTAAIAAAEGQGLRVLQSRPAESETALSFSGIGDLLDGVLDEALAPLPEPQRHALARALVLEEKKGSAPDERVVGIALLGALRSLAETTPLLVAVDDVQWLDAASAATFAYAARRLRTERIGVLLARRAAVESPLLAELVRSLPPDRVRRVDVRPFDPSALHHVVRRHLGVALPRPLLAEVHEASGGNPFYALEIVRTLQRTGLSVEAGQPLPVPDSLHDLVHGRLLALPPDSREFLLAAAALSDARVELVESASGVSRRVGLAPALDAGVVELEGDRIRFTHPLLAAGAYEAANPLRRAEVHARLAKLVDDPEARGRHLAASADEPDELVASALVEAALHARARGALRAAALLLDRAQELTPDAESDPALRRRIDAAYLHFEAGDSPRAEAQLLDVIDRLPAGSRRARGLVRLARVRSYEAQREAADLFLEAIDEAEEDLELLAVAHEGVATCLFRLRERLVEAVEHARIAARLALEVGDDALAAEALGTQLVAETLLGVETATETAKLALALQEASKERRVLAQPLFAVAVHWWWTDEIERARGALVELLQRAHELGDESSPPYVLVLLGRVECLFGDLQSALERAREGQQSAEQSGQRTLFAYNLALEALAHAKLGRVESARAAALEALKRVPATGGRPAELVAREALGHLELALGAPEVALSWLEPSTAFTRRERIAEPAAVGFVPDQVEALIELDRSEEAIELLDWYEGNARRVERASALATCLRCRGLLAAQEAALDDALAAFSEALTWHERVEIPIERGRTLIALGAVQRRMKKRSEARNTFEAALEIFEGFGAALWAVRARDELRRISGRAKTPGALTPAEERVAALVAEGKTNREVAAALFLSDRTVEGHLSHIFGKLGVRSRTQLARALASHFGQEIEPSNTGDSPVSPASSKS